MSATHRGHCSPHLLLSRVRFLAHLHLQLATGDKLLVLEPALFSDIRRKLSVEDEALAAGFDPAKLACGDISAKFSEVCHTCFVGHVSPSLPLLAFSHHVDVRLVLCLFALHVWPLCFGLAGSELKFLLPLC